MTTWNGKRLPTILGRCVGQIVILCYTLLYYSVTCVDVKPQREIYVPNYNVYHNLTRIDKEVEYLSKFPNYVKVYTQHKSRQNRYQYLLHISNFTKHSEKFDNMVEKPQILFSFGEHAREFLPVESAIFFIRNLTDGLLPDVDSFSRQFTQQILSLVDLYIILMANPDGRHYVEQSKNYCWRGTSTGVDLDRNFGWEFGGKGSSSDTEDEEYRGKDPFSGRLLKEDTNCTSTSCLCFEDAIVKRELFFFSEPESLVFQEITSDVSFDAFFSFHSGINHIYIPYSGKMGIKLWKVAKTENITDWYTCKSCKIVFLLWTVWDEWPMLLQIQNPDSSRECLITSRRCWDWRLSCLAVRSTGSDSEPHISSSTTQRMAQYLTTWQGFKK